MMDCVFIYIHCSMELQTRKREQIKKFEKFFVFGYAKKRKSFERERRENEFERERERDRERIDVS